MKELLTELKIVCLVVCCFGFFFLPKFYQFFSKAVRNSGGEKKLGQ